VIATTHPGPNILVIVADTTRADALWPDAGTPTAGWSFDPAAEGRVFQRATSPSPWTPPAHGSLFTGLAPSEHGIWGPNLLDEHGWPRAGTIAGRVLERWLPNVLGRMGYRTFAVSANAWIGPYLGFDHGFDRFVSIRENPSGRTRRNPTAQLARMAPSRFLTPVRRRRVRRHIQRRGQDWGATTTIDMVDQLTLPSRGPFFGFLNLMEPHWPYHPPSSFEGFTREEARRAVDVLVRYRSPITVERDGPSEALPHDDVAMLRRLYAGEVGYLRSRLNELVGRLAGAGRLDDTVIVIVGDHGEHLGEHGLLGHVGSVHEELVHVPMLLMGPPQLVGRGVEPSRVSTQELYRATLKWARGEAASLRSEEPVVAEYEGSWHHAGSLRRTRPAAPARPSEGARWSIYETDWKLEVRADGQERLFDLRRDPDEVAPVEGDPHQRSLREQLRSVLTERAPTMTGSAEASGSRDPQVEGELRALGYL